MIKLSFVYLLNIEVILMNIFYKIIVDYFFTFVNLKQFF